jgi:hypothetical protein
MRNVRVTVDATEVDRDGVALAVVLRDATRAAGPLDQGRGEHVMAALDAPHRVERLLHPSQLLLLEVGFRLPTPGLRCQAALLNLRWHQPAGMRGQLAARRHDVVCGRIALTGTPRHR